MIRFEDFYNPISYPRIQLSRILEGGIVHTVDSPLGLQFKKSGAEIKGDESVFPGIFKNGSIHIFTYQLRRLCTSQANTIMPFNGVPYAKCVENPYEFKEFWDHVKLPEPPWFWGSAAVVYTKSGKVLLGFKSRERNTYGGTLTPPAGIVDVNDFANHKYVNDTLRAVSLRELFEETGFDTSTFTFVGIEPHWDIKRNKPQAFVLWRAEEENLSYAIEHEYSPSEREFDDLVLINTYSEIEQKNLSTEGVAALQLAKRYLE